MTESLAEQSPDVRRAYVLGASMVLEAVEDLVTSPPVGHHSRCGRAGWNGLARAILLKTTIITDDLEREYGTFT